MEISIRLFGLIAAVSITIGIIFLAFDVLSLGCAFYKLRIFLV
jgi:hypothetical protein